MTVSRTTSVPLIRLAPRGGLLRALLDDSGALADVVPSLPRSAAEALDRLPEGRSPAAPETVQAVRRSLEGMDAPPAALANADALGREGTMAVVAGQQPGLLGGPLYTALKAAGTVRAAEVLEAEERARGSDRRWVPVFWNASEDHDLDEVNAVVLPDERGAPRRLRADLAADGRAGRDVPADGPEIEDLLAGVEALLPGGPGRAGALALLRETRVGSIASWFGRIFTRLLGPRGLVVVEPDHVRAATVDLLTREILEPGRLTEAVRRGADRLRALGFRPVLDADREVNLFAFHEGRRRAVTRDGAVFQLEGTGVVLAPAALLARIREEPGAFSTNVALRPLVQDAALPAAIQLAGPTELAYLAELGPAHDDAGIPRAIVLPRPSATLVEARVERALGRLGLRADDVVSDPSKLDDAVGGDDEEEAVRRRLGALRNELAPALDDILGRAGPEGSASRRRAVRIAGHLLENLGKMERTVVDALRTRRGVGRRHVERVRHALRPLGLPQERVYGILPFLARHGTGLIDRLIDAIDPFAYDHRIVRLARRSTN